MSLRQIAKQLGVSHTLLVLWRQGKRTLPPELERRYYQLVTTGYNPKRVATQEPVNKVVGQPGLEPGTSVLSGLRSNRLSYWPTEEGRIAASSAPVEVLGAVGGDRPSVAIRQP